MSKPQISSTPQISLTPPTPPAPTIVNDAEIEQLFEDAYNATIDAN